MAFPCRGIGLETCIRFAQEGANILMADISAPALGKAVAKLKEVFPSVKRVETKVCDVSKESSVEETVSTAFAIGSGHNSDPLR